MLLKDAYRQLQKAIEGFVVAGSWIQHACWFVLRLFEKNPSPVGLVLILPSGGRMPNWIFSH